jgi:RsiW-degrading membrane proteinase PrsW (M82 family)
MVQSAPTLVANRQIKSTAVTTPTGKNPKALKWLLLAFALLAMAFMGLATIAMIGGLNTGPIGLILGMGMAVLLVPLYLSLAIWIDRFEPEPPLLLALTFIWGATGAVFFAFLLNTAGEIAVSKVFGETIGGIYGLSVSAPIVEESCKGIALFAIFFFRRDEFDGVLDGIVYAAMVGLGFAMTENFSYYGRAIIEGPGPGIFTYILRGMILPFAHPLFTSMTGIGLGIAARTQKKPLKILAPIGGFILAMSLHSFNNSIGQFLAAIGGAAGAILGLFTLILAIPFFCLCVMVIAFFALRSEGRTVRTYLQPEVATGFFSQPEVDCLCSIPKRFKASFGAWRAGGFGGYRARARFHHVAAELAFFRDRIARGTLAQDANAIAQENEFRLALTNLRSQLPRTI